jgi:hypothetical protein
MGGNYSISSPSWRRVLVPASLSVRVIDLNRLFFKVIKLPLLALGYISFYILSIIGIRTYVSLRMGEP